MQNKVISIKEPKLGIMGWLIKLTYRNPDLSDVAMSLMQKLSPEQAIALITAIPKAKIKTVFADLSNKLRANTEVVVATLSTANYYDLESIYNALYEDVKQNEDVLAAYLSHTSRAFLYHTLKQLLTTNPDLINNKKVILAALRNAQDYDTKKIFVSLPDALKEDIDIIGIVWSN